MYSLKSKALAFSLIISPLLIGGFIYLFFRSDTTIFIKHVPALPFLNNSEVFKNQYLPNWIVYNLPDALWILSLTYAMMFIWNFKITSESVGWITLAPTIGVAYELGQLAGVISGTFDIIDLLSMMLILIIPSTHIVLTHKKYSNEKR